MAKFQNHNKPIAASACNSSTLGSRSRTTLDNVFLRTTVYKRSNNNFSKISVNSSATAWSQLSKRSLADVSNLSMIQLPVYRTQLSNGHLYEWPTVGNIGCLSSASNEIERAVAFENQSEASEHLSGNRGVGERVAGVIDDSEDILL